MVHSTVIVKSNALEREVHAFFLGLLNSQTTGLTKVPWSRLSKEDFNGWPMGVEFNDRGEWDMTDLMAILDERDQIKFKKIFSKDDIASFKSLAESHDEAEPQTNHLKSSISDIRTSTRRFMLGLLKKVTGDETATLIPWRHITKDDLEGWPPGIDVMDPEFLTKEEQLAILANRDNIQFKEDFKAKYDRLILNKSRKRKKNDAKNIQTNIGLIKPDENEVICFL